MSELMLEIGRKGPSLLEAEARRYEYADDYLFDLFEKTGESPSFIRYDDFLADIYDREYGEGLKSRDVGNAFSLGIVLGLRLAKELVPNLIASNMGGVHLERVKQDEPMPDVFDAGDLGYERVTELHPLIEEWERVAFSDPNLWPYFRRGFGLVMSDILAAVIVTSEQGPDVTMLQFSELRYDWGKSIEEIPTRLN